MHSHELEDLTLLLVRDTDEAEMWIDRWAVSYPTVRTAAAARIQSISAWQNTVQQAWDTVHSRNAAIVAHGAGVSAVLAWLYRADMAALRRVRNIILAAPLAAAFPDDAEHTLQRARCPCPAALVIGQNDPDCPPDWAQQLAARIRATPIPAPQSGRLNGQMQGWQWGMKLMQEMLLS
ncbi:Predicted esterase of the alpha/beta hydrolase fold [Kingella potus]|uniref:Predicted esterase of the alpha/beta hydrolase fold n=1 Tax=Kingella potus TaxID=265175 RepID=A0A377R1M7_9NEIS|nr:alpha/beta hydrolase [Kingella potus]UOP00158.1 alpha/beta hydrolase [Kingella potus]STR02780.1 Predicted esterase of the alpha/beta hydrolase fold [Kingella potus]